MGLLDGNPLKKLEEAASDFIDDVIDNPEKLLGLPAVLTHDIAKEALSGLIDYLIEDPNIDREKGVLLNKSGNTHKIPVVYGQRKVGGIVAFVGVSGTKNELLHLVLVLSEGEINSIGDVYIDDIISTDARFTGLINIRKYTGASGQAVDSVLNTAFPSKWGTDKTLDSTAYLACQFTWTDGSKAFHGMPRVHAVIQGRKVFDTRTSTTAYSDNPALCLYDYLTNARYGQGLATAKLNTASFNAAANECEVQITESDADAGTINQYATNGVVETSNKVLQNIISLLRQCNGFLPYVQGQYYLVIDKLESSGYTFDLDNIIGPISVTLGDKREKLNQVRVKYTNPVKDWQGDIATSTSSTFLTADNNLLLERELALPHETSIYRAINEAERLLKLSRETITVSFQTTIEALKLKTTDVVDITYSDLGWTNKLFRLINMELSENGNINVTLLEHTASAYNRTVPVEQAAPPNTDLPDPLNVAAPTGFTVDGSEAQLFLNSAGVVTAGAYLSWDNPNNIFIVETQIRYKLTSDSVYKYSSVKGEGNTSVTIPILDDGKNYDFGIRHISGLGASSVWSDTSVLVEGKTSPPPDVATFNVSRQSDGTREFTWTFPTPPLDADGFVIKYVSGTGGAWASMAVVPGAEQILKGVRKFETNQLLAGTYTFGIKAIDTTGNESTNAAIIEATLGDPRLADAFEIVDLVVDGWSGTKTNCEVDEYNVLHATDTKTWTNLTTWTAFTTWYQTPNTSVTYEHGAIDLGGIVSFTPVVNVVHTGDTLTIQEAHSDDDISYTSFAAVAGVITARYVKIKITVTVTSGYIQLSGGTIILSGSPVSEVIEDLNTSTLATCVSSPACATSGYRIAAGDFRAPIAASYTKIKRVNVIFQNSGAGWTYELIDKDTTVGPRLKLYNSSGTLADATVDIDITGL